MDWIKDYYSKKGTLSARIYRLREDDTLILRVMYNNCTEDLPFYISPKGNVTVGNISCNILTDSGVKSLAAKVKDAYGIPEYVCKDTCYMLKALMFSWR